MTAEALAGQVAAFAQRLRGAGVAVDTGKVVTACSALVVLRPTDLTGLYWATRLALCSDRRELPIFDAVFAEWFGGCCPPDTDATGPGDDHVRTIPADRREDGDERTGRTCATGAAGADAADRRDLRALSPDELLTANRVVALLRPARRHLPSWRGRRGGRRRIDPVRTVRQMVRADGEPHRLRFRRPTVRFRRLTLLVDVSESMETYREAYVHFAHAAVAADPPRTEVFTLGTTCTRVTALLRRPAVGGALVAVAGRDTGWGGGTLLGGALRDLLRRHAGRDVLRGATVVVMSDGHDAGSARILVAQVARLSRLAYRLVWVNPQQGWPGYQPMAPGLVASLRHVDEQLSGHSVGTLRELAEVIAR